ncbi:SRPBCC family protein [Chryseobacterium gallinarum]|uniref:Glutathione S-transferase n=1 Tax=Chryseobacterium gallinarum TaxID=1324352 RepID=A0A0G3M1K2_CHRGL|nr:SRPBCC domain-containing protein [Chryseobacterium gallinarum]AKK72759.1 glutathione S-transferase [Chryseobacterium gallinarum]MCL8536371.1 SRPBCC domain-containing protein [Chryseobacterium gallinarum]QIY91502.1 SRPBCC domain-containing protein [Chryseobacterium gallinarum]
MKSNIVFNKDFDSNTAYVMKIYNADVSKVWNYFTLPELLDQWWGPKPWRCETLRQDFKEGGIWLYAMVGPDGEKHYSQSQYGEIIEHRSLDWMSAFCDEKGMINEDFPRSKWLIGFTGVEEGTKVTVNIHYQSAEIMKKMFDMGFEEGFTMGLNQLEEIIGN